MASFIFNKKSDKNLTVTQETQKKGKYMPEYELNFILSETSHSTLKGSGKAITCIYKLEGCAMLINFANHLTKSCMFPAISSVIRFPYQGADSQSGSWGLESIDTDIINQQMTLPKLSTT